MFLIIKKNKSKPIESDNDEELEKLRLEALNSLKTPKKLDENQNESKKSEYKSNGKL